VAARRAALVSPLRPNSLRAFPCGEQPPTSNVNALADDVIANSVTVGVDDDGRLCIFSRSATTTLLDVTGWWIPQNIRRAAGGPTTGNFARIEPKHDGRNYRVCFTGPNTLGRRRDRTVLSKFVGAAQQRLLDTRRRPQPESMETDSPEVLTGNRARLSR
jgi:hypothetical protein